MRYIVNGSSSTKKFLEVVREHNSGYEVEITCIGENYSTSTTDFMSRNLFESCVRTGYISSLE